MRTIRSGMGKTYLLSREHAAVRRRGEMKWLGEEWGRRRLRGEGREESVWLGGKERKKLGGGVKRETGRGLEERR